MHDFYPVLGWRSGNLIGRAQFPPAPALDKNRSPIFFIFFRSGRGEGGVRGAGEGGGVGVFFLKEPRRWGLQKGRGGRPGRVSAANWGIGGGGGLNIFFSWPKCPPSTVALFFVLVSSPFLSVSSKVVDSDRGIHAPPPQNSIDQNRECKTGGDVHFAFFLGSGNSHHHPPPPKIRPDEEGLLWGWCVGRSPLCFLFCLASFFLVSCSHPRQKHKEKQALKCQNSGHKSQTSIQLSKISF